MSLGLNDFDVIVVNDTSGKEFGFRGVTGFSSNQNQPAIAIPIINNGPGSTLFFRFSGQQEFITFSFVLYDDGSDVSDGDSIVTAIQQHNYLRENIFTAEFNTSWTLKQANHYTSSEGVVISDLTINREYNSGGYMTGSITLQRGRVFGA